MRKRRLDKNVYRALAMITQFGINMLVPMCMMTALGIFLDNKLGTSFITVVLFFIGALAGGQNVYRMAKRVYDSPTDAGKGHEQDEMEPSHEKDK